LEVPKRVFEFVIATPREAIGKSLSEDEIASFH